MPWKFKRVLNHRHSLKGSGWLDSNKPRTTPVLQARLQQLVDKYGPVMDRHPLLWLRDLSEVLGKSVGETLDELLGGKE